MLYIQEGDTIGIIPLLGLNLVATPYFPREEGHDWGHHCCLCGSAQEAGKPLTPLFTFLSPRNGKLLLLFKGTTQMQEILCLRSPC